MLSRRRQKQMREKRIVNRVYRRRAQLKGSINNEDTLNLIRKLSQQITTDDLINQFFNGFHFY
jgi:hypothetical protein